MQQTPATGQRSLILDTETTGLDPATGDRVLEVAAVELLNLVPTGRHFHTLIDPERDVPEEAARIHGFTREMLVGQPKFAEILPGLLEFLGDDPVIAHNAAFDFNFLDHEFKRAGQPPIPRARMVDTLAMAKKRFPGLPNSLDALCRRYGIDNTMRTAHNALLDVQLLAQVYLELMGGKQPGFELASNRMAATPAPLLQEGGQPVARVPRPVPVSAEEQATHVAFMPKLKDPLWPSTEGWPGARG